MAASCPESTTTSDALRLCVAVGIVMLMGGPSSTAGAQADTSIVGTVTDICKAPAPGASVILTGGPEAQVQIADREGRFAFRGLSAGVYVVEARLQSFVPEISKPIMVSDGTQTRLDLRLDIGRIQEVSWVVISPASLYRAADAVAHVRVGAPSGTQVVHGRENVVSDVTVITTFKRPTMGAPQPSWRQFIAPPDDQIADGRTLRVLQYAGAMPHSARPPAEAGGELLALLDWSCREQWEFGATFPLRAGRVVVSSDRNAWSALNGLAPSAFVAALERLAP